MASNHTPNPVTSIAVWDNIRSIECIIDEADQGLLYNPAYLVERIMRDDRIYGAVMTRILGLLGRHLDFEPAKETAQGRNIAEELEDDWPKMFEHSGLVRLLTWGLLLGVGIAQVIQQRDRWYLEVWHPHQLRWDPNRRVWIIRGKNMPETVLEELDDGGWVDPDGVRWVLFTPYGIEDAPRHGLFNKLARLYLERQEALRDRSRYSEKHGNPMHLGIAPAASTADEVNSFAGSLGNIGSEPVVVARQGEPGNQWDVRLVEATGRSQDLFEQEIAQLDRAIATVILGQSQTTDGQAGLGSNAEAGEPVRLDIMRADKDALADCLRMQFLVPYCDFHYGNGEMAPYPCWNVDPPEDKAYVAKVHLDQANADNVYIQAGVLTPEEVALSRFGSGESEYSLDTEIDTETRQSIADLSAQQMQVEAQKALEEAKNPTPTPQPGANGIAPSNMPPNGKPKPNGAPV